ncbi:hypothetical protein [Dactylosporangium salmoneum]|uniref:Uncharacterized protein n=1 Tax=Dactylosporangium salmoneum TaxID=53361 RepID=A0ABN3H717_9ACTN
MLDDAGPGRPVTPAWSSMVAASVLALTVGLVSMPLALAARGRLPSGGLTDVTSPVQMSSEHKSLFLDCEKVAS